MLFVAWIMEAHVPERRLTWSIVKESAVKKFLVLLPADAALRLFQ